MTEDNIIEIGGKKYRHRSGIVTKNDLVIHTSYMQWDHLHNRYTQKTVHFAQKPHSQEIGKLGVILEPIREKGPWERESQGKEPIWYDNYKAQITTGRKALRIANIHGSTILHLNDEESTKVFLLDAVRQAKALGLIESCVHNIDIN